MQSHPAAVVDLCSHLIEEHEILRRDLARFLHDEVSQSLILLKMNLLQSESSKSATDNCTQLIDDTLKKVRDRSLALRPSLLDDLGLVTALSWYLRNAPELHEKTYQLDTEPRNLKWDRTTALTCYRLVQRVVENGDPARGQTLEIRLRSSATSQTLSFNNLSSLFANADWAKKPNPTLLEVQMRVAQLGGTLEYLYTADTATGLRIEFSSKI